MTAEKIVLYDIEPGAHRIKELPGDLQPREMLARHGPASVPDEVLLAILLRTGMKGKNVLELSRELLHTHFRSLGALALAGEGELSRVKGLGRVKALTLLAAFELARRLKTAHEEPRPAVRTPEDVYALLRDEAEAADQEVFWLLPLDTKNRLIPARPLAVTTGTLNASLVHPREVFRLAVKWSSAAVLLAHNHPSGDPAPSSEDVSLTRQLVAAGRTMGISVLDHVILGRAKAGLHARHVSLREAGLVAFE